MTATKGQRNSRLLLSALLLTSGVLAAALWLLQRAENEPPPRARCTTRSPCVAIVIDDIGRDLRTLDKLLAIDEQLTFSVLPHGRVTPESTKRLAQAKRETWLHLPLEPLDREQITDEKVILESTGPVAARFEACLAEIPGAAGVTTHMGSRFSQMPDRLSKLMTSLAKAGLGILDSRTTANTRVCVMAKAQAVPCLERHVFIDDHNDSGSIGGRIGAGAAVARERGWAILVGHPLPETIDSLRDFSARRGRLRIVRLSELPGW